MSMSLNKIQKANYIYKILVWLTWKKHGTLKKEFYRNDMDILKEHEVINYIDRIYKEKVSDEKYNILALLCGIDSEKIKKYFQRNKLDIYKDSDILVFYKCKNWKNGGTKKPKNWDELD